MFDPNVWPTRLESSPLFQAFDPNGTAVAGGAPIVGRATALIPGVGLPANIITFTDGVNYYQIMILDDPADPVISPATTVQRCSPETWVFDQLGETASGQVLRTCNAAGIHFIQAVIVREDTERSVSINDQNLCNSGPDPDTDHDGVCDPGFVNALCTGSDLCPSTQLGAAVDANGCSQADVDPDADGICSPGAPSAGPAPGCAGTDNCADASNPAQTNTDVLVNPPGDGLGDACDPDDDDDGVSDVDEETSAGSPPGNNIGSDPLDPASTPEVCDGSDNDLNEGIDEGYTDTDGDAVADCVDPDDDNDTLPDAIDNCDLVQNPVQDDFNADGEGDACDDTDGDGLLDSVDLCRLVADPDQGDADGDGRANPCDSDDDNDTVVDWIDNCRLTPNPSQADMNANGTGDACEDQDADGVVDGNDNCVLVPNNGQQNNDGDALGDACDSDDDNDGVPDITDNCALPNPGQEDVNVNGIGDACEDADVDGDGLGDICDPSNAGQTVVSDPGTGAVTVASASSDIVFTGTTATPASTVTIVPDTTGAGTITTDASGTGLVAQRYDLLSPSSLTGTITQIVDFPMPGITAGQLASLTVTKEQTGGPLTLTHNVISTMPPSGEPITQATIDYFLPNDAAMVVKVPADSDMDGIVDQYDLNGDGDFLDALERDNCLTTVNGNQLNTDAAVAPPGDALGDACDSDDDDDGYFDSVEAHVGTNGLLPCGGTATWPADLATGGFPDSTNRLNVLDITSFIAPVRYLGTNLGSHPGDVRWDLVPGKGPFLTDINVTDLTSLIVVKPPWTGGVRAFNGPVCPFAQ